MRLISIESVPIFTENKRSDWPQTVDFYVTVHVYQRVNLTKDVSRFNFI